ncbi:uncharacterized protein LOC143549774 [Bidens hawaiensis]|uniref:uncharacterized protein LOC143549774 n=1 Tax=Bidens hawaiensis TaxID=980011 RepID=UPI00404ABEC5
MWSGGWQGWKDVPIFHRERMFERFQKYYQWEAEEKDSVHSCWERCIKGKFPNLLSKARKFAKTRTLQKGIKVGKDWGVTIPFKPQWISQDSWEELIKVWNTSSWQDKSSQNSKNRENATGGRHTVGSKSFVTVRKEMDNTLKRRAKFGEFWLQKHAKKGSRPLDKLPVCSELVDVDLEEANDVEDIIQEKNVDWVDPRAGEAYVSLITL